jgi:uncharacterized protein (TIGR02594 family)
VGCGRSFLSTHYNPFIGMLAGPSNVYRTKQQGKFRMGHSIPSSRNQELGAIWIDSAQGEIGQREAGGTRINPKIAEYFRASKFWGEDDSGEKNAWCGSFAAWVMSRHDYVPPKNSFRAKEWLNFGQRLDLPVYGAIGVKSRKGGGHVAFIVGQNVDGTKYFMLGGNQGNSVNVTEYPASVWDSFVFPTGVSPSSSLPIYDGVAGQAGSES